MDLDGSRLIVAGASGALGSRLARGLHAQGARVVLAARSPERLRDLSSELGDAPMVALDLADPGPAVAAAADALGGVDGVVLATGAVAFGRASELAPEIAKELLEVNVLGPIRLIAQVLARIEGKGCVVALSAIVADHPTAGMAAYSASKAALSAYLTALRREVRRDGVNVLDVRPPHLDTDFADHALAGSPPALPEPLSADVLVAEVIAALAAGRRELGWSLTERALVAG